MNYFFEIADIFIEKYGLKYIARYDQDEQEFFSGINYRISLYSTRVWVTDGKVVRYLKNRFSTPQETVVDLKEFAWIAMKCQTI